MLQQTKPPGQGYVIEKQTETLKKNLTNSMKVETLPLSIHSDIRGT